MTRRELQGRADDLVVRAIREIYDSIQNLDNRVIKIQDSPSTQTPASPPNLQSLGLNIALTAPISFTSGSGTPEGVVQGNIGDFYFRQIDGTPGAAVYVKESGQSTRTGWTSIVTSGGGSAVTSVFTRSGAVVATTGDYTFAQIGGTLTLAGLPVFANNAAAVLGGLAVGALYRTGGDPSTVCVVF